MHVEGSQLFHDVRAKHQKAKYEEGTKDKYSQKLLAICGRTSTSNVFPVRYLQVFAISGEVCFVYTLGNNLTRAAGTAIKGAVVDLFVAKHRFGMTF